MKIDKIINLIELARVHVDAWHEERVKKSEMLDLLAEVKKGIQALPDDEPCEHEKAKYRSGFHCSDCGAIRVDNTIRGVLKSTGEWQKPNRNK